MGHASVNVEREVKFRAGLEFELPDLRQLGLGVVQLPAQTLSTSYFDTQDLRLWQQKITLRHRLGEADGGGTWTLKLPGKPAENEVDRTELSWPGGPGEIPLEATELHTWDRAPTGPRSNRRSRSQPASSVGPEWRLPLGRDR